MTDGVGRRASWRAAHTAAAVGRLRGGASFALFVLVSAAVGYLLVSGPISGIFDSYTKVALVAGGGLLLALALGNPPRFVVAWVFVAVLANKIALFGPGDYTNELYTGYAFAAAFALVGMAVALVVRAPRRLTDFRLLWPLGVFFGVVLLGFSYSSAGLVVMAKRYVSMWSLPAVAIYSWAFLGDAADRRRVVLAVLLAGLVLAPVSIYQFAYQVGGELSEAAYRVRGVGGWNIGNVTFHALPLMLAVGVWPHRRELRIGGGFLGLVGATQAAALALTFSRVGYISVAVAFGVALVLNLQGQPTSRMLARGTVLVAVVVLLSALAAQVLPILNPRLQGVSFAALQNERVRIWIPAITLGLERPLTGWGFLEEDALHTSAFGLARDFDVHSFYLQTFYNHGLMGLLALAILMGGIVAALVRALRAPDGMANAVGKGLLAMTLYVVMASVTATEVLFNTTANASYWMLLGALLAIGPDPVARPSVRLPEGAPAPSQGGDT